MSSSKERVPLAKALVLVGEVIEILRPTCDRIEIAGSIRRNSMMVGDIELVVIPKARQVAAGLFEDVTTERDLHFARVKELVEQGALTHRPDKNEVKACGPRYQRLCYEGMPLDIFSVKPPAEFGVIFAIRTGPAEFSKALVTKRPYGFLQMGMQVLDGRLLDRGRPQETPEELDFFKLIGLQYIEPEHRAERAQRLARTA